MSHGFILFVLAVAVLSLVKRLVEHSTYQAITKKKVSVRIFVISCVFVIGLMGLSSHVPNMMGFLLGSFVGFLPAWYGVNKTDFKFSDGLIKYKPSMASGIFVVIVFFGRLLYSCYTIYKESLVPGVKSNDAMYVVLHTPMTSGAFGFLVGYYWMYFFLLSRLKIFK